jgi:hypothetical protein
VDEWNLRAGLYRLTSGRIGGRMGDGTILLLTITGRKSGPLLQAS